MASLLEMAWDVVSRNEKIVSMTKEEILSEVRQMYHGLSTIEKGEVLPAEVVAQEDVAPPISKRKAFGKKQVICMLCGKGMTTLARHLKTSHGMKPGEYRKQFAIPRTQALAAKDYSESRRQMAMDRGLGENLAKARAARGKAKAPTAPTKEAKPKAARKPRAKKVAAAPVE
jgi:predicted transcriptional regulator